MRFAGQPSWSLHISYDDLPHIALYVRDAVGLAVPTAGEVPPRLARDPVDRSAALSAGDRQDAAQQWPSWWRAVVQHATTWRARATQAEGTDRAAQLSRQRDAVGAPPEFAGLANRPALLAAALAASPEAYRDCLPPVEVRRRPLFRGLANGIAEDVAFDRGVSLDDLRGSVQVLGVHGQWWHLVGPGTALCSPGAADDPAVGNVLLRRLFDSAVGH